MIKQLFFVGLGGATGSIVRYLVWLGISRFSLGALFPFATFAANLTGCILIGFLSGLSVRSNLLLEGPLRLLLITGFCGGYTTFSAFSLEGLRLLEHQHYLSFVLYAAGSCILCIAGAGFGMYLSRL
ncbi:MAG: fluoride efflux transporter CrcB [Tannerellaceae bacterium]|jgi:CrcB protein|nr:fluoride efflux transporter CrcB [Tannerellaceae bacterium]